MIWSRSEFVEDLRLESDFWLLAGSIEVSQSGKVWPTHEATAVLDVTTTLISKVVSEMEIEKM
jgi:hypothetical protein